MSNMVTKIIFFAKYMKYICTCQKKAVPLCPNFVCSRASTLAYVGKKEVKIDEEDGRE